MDAYGIVGRTEHEARETLNRRGLILRVTDRDGRACPGSYDLMPERVNVAVVAGTVTEILSRG